MTAPKRFKLTAPVAREHAEQVALFRWAAVAARRDPRLALLFAVPNGMRTNIHTAYHTVRAGLRRGVPDVCLPVASGDHHGLFIEMKRRDGVPSDVSSDQSWWLAALSEQGYKAAVAFGWEKAASTITAYLYGPLSADLGPSRGID